MLLKLKYIFLFCGLMGVSNTIFAQYKGGSSSGGKDINSLVLLPACTPPENTSIYFGGDANGAAISKLEVVCSSIPENGNIYFGGNANGAASSILQTLPVCIAPENLSISFGGTGNGDANINFISCIPPESNSIYFGGNANDAAFVNITNCPVAIPVNIFSGGIADGYNCQALQQQSCSAAQNTNVFFGGAADGIAKSYLLQVSCSAPEASNMFFGGSADGYTKSSLNQVLCPAAENTSIYIGGVADGYSTKSLSLSVCPPVENYNISFGGNADGYAKIALIQSICALPENTQIFQGGNSNGEAVVLFNQSTCSYPENVNIFLGGFSDGYYVRNLSQQVCGIPENINVFAGGSSDGYTIIKLQQSAICSTPENVNVSSGGVGDGNAISNLVSCIPSVNINFYYGGVSNDAAYANIINCPVATPVNIYIGGNANGAANSSIIVACPPAQNTSIYFGGIANGASLSKLIRLPICSPPENLNIYSGGVANGAAASKLLLLPACPIPDNINIYFGGSANGAANSQKITLTCPPPPNENIFFGGIADGYARRLLIQPYYWTGAKDHNWHDALNWSSEAVPDISSLAIIPIVVNYPIVSLGNAVTNGLVIQTGAKIIISNKNFTSEFDIVNDGTISISGNPLITIGGDFQSQNGTISTGNAKFLFNAVTGIQSVNFNTADALDVEIATMPLASCQLAGDLIVRQDLIISSGTFNAASYNIYLNRDWSNAGSFIPGTGTVLFGGIYQVISTSGEHFYNLTTQNNTQLILNNNIQVTNNLTLSSGTISTGIYTLTLGNGIPSPGTLNYTNGQIIGMFERWIATNDTYLFPVGTASNIESVNLTVNSGLTSGSILSYFITGNPGSSGLPVSESGKNIISQFTEGYWNLTAANGLSIGNYNMSLNANGFTSNTFNSETRILKRTNGGAWMLDGTHIAAVNPNCFRNGLTGGISGIGTQFDLGASDCVGGQIGNDQSICSGLTPASFTNTNATEVDPSYTYTWQFTTNASAVPGDGNWTNIPSSNTYDLTYLTPLTQTTRFIRQASTPCGLEYSNLITVTVLPLPVTGQMYHLPNDFGL